MGWACSTYGGEERCIQGLGGEKEGKRLLEKPRLSQENNIKMYLQEVGWGFVDWIDLAQCRHLSRDRWRALLNAVMNFRVL